MLRVSSVFALPLHNSSSVCFFLPWSRVLRKTSASLCHTWLGLSQLVPGKDEMPTQVGCSVAFLLVTLAK